MLANALGIYFTAWFIVTIVSVLCWRPASSNSADVEGRGNRSSSLERWDHLSSSPACSLRSSCSSCCCECGFGLLVIRWVSTLLIERGVNSMISQFKLMPSLQVAAGGFGFVSGRFTFIMGRS